MKKKFERKRSVKRKKHGSKFRNASGEEGEKLLKEEKCDEGSLEKCRRKALETQLPRRMSHWAPSAVATNFSDVPVFTVCPYCRDKIVTKTQFTQEKDHW